MKRPLRPFCRVASKSIFVKSKRLVGSARSLPSLSDRLSNARLIDNLRHYQAELEIQNKALRFSQEEAEGASERFITLFSHVPLALMVVEENGLILETNGRALDLLRPLESDPPLNFLYPFVSTSALDRVRLCFLLAKEQGVYEMDEVEFSGGSNGIFTGDIHVARIEHNTDDAPRFICAILDQGPLLSQRRALQLSTQTLQERNDELVQSKSRLSSIINSSLDAIICIDKNQRIMVFNPAASGIFQCSADQAIGRVLTDFLPDAQRALSYSDITIHAQLGEMTGLTSQGQLVALEVSVSFEHQPDGAVITFFAHDLSVRKKMEAHRAALESQLRESQKMQAIGTMAGGIAHDFNNIISAILGNVVLAQMDLAPQSAAATCLDEIDKAGKRARDLVRQILTFSRNDPPKRCPIRLGEVVHETLRLVKVTLPPLVRLSTNIDPNTPQVLADATQIEQALLNLCNNAVHAMGNQPGEIFVTLSASIRPAEDLPERRGGIRGQHVKLSVTDSGSGMNEATLERIFEPFFTTKPVGQGTGLGLSVVHGIMRSHMGNVTVQSVLGQGSTFNLLFPITDELDESIPLAPPEPTFAMGQGQSVWVVDDDEALVFLLKRLLSRKGYQVFTFTDPLQALAQLRDPTFVCHLLVTDYNMPGYSGLDVLRTAKLVRPTLPVAMASGYVTPEIERAALEAGAKALIHKPNDVDEFCVTVQQLLAGTKY